MDVAIRFYDVSGRMNYFSSWILLELKVPGKIKNIRNSGSEVDAFKSRQGRKS